MVLLDSQTIAYMLTLIAQYILFTWAFNKKSNAIDKERESWANERKDLMDRIQAPSFAEYANKVVREKKAEQPQEEETPVEFVS